MKSLGRRVQAMEAREGDLRLARFGDGELLAMLGDTLDAMGDPMLMQRFADRDWTRLIRQLEQMPCEA